MLNITSQKNNTIYYTCSCGANGMCSFKPLDHSAIIVINLMCPACSQAERLTLLQYNSNETKEECLKSLNSVDLSWVPTINEEL